VKVEISVCTLYTHRSSLIQAVGNQWGALISPIAGIKPSVVPVLLRLCTSVIPFLITLVMAQVFSSWHPYRA
jgi:hypothetical protein